jgi:geranylgeranyl reductase
VSNRFDVIIIGAGPAGLACARALAGSSLRVLLFESKETIGPKVCAGGLTRIAAQFGIPGEARSFSIQTVFVDERPPFLIDLTHPLKIVDRATLAAHHLKGIEKAPNVEVAAATRVIGLAENAVTTNRGVFHFRHLVAADGSQSFVRRHLGLPTKFGIGLYYEVPQRADEVVFQFKPRIIRSGYLWIFPHRSFTNIGIGFNPDTLTAGLAKVILQQFLQERGFSRDGIPLRGGLISHLYCGHQFGNIFLAGDAAGLASKASGEGIPSALVSGREIGRKILDPAYDMAEFRDFLALKRRQEGYWRFFESLPGMQGFLLSAYFTMMKRHWMQVYMGY